MRIIRFYDCFGRLPIDDIRKESEAIAKATEYVKLTGRMVTMKQLSRDRRSKCVWEILVDGSTTKTWSPHEIS